MEAIDYTKVSAFTDLGIHHSASQHFSDDILPNGIEQCCEFVQNLLIHAYWLTHYDYQIDEAIKLSEMQTRYSDEILDIVTSKLQRPLHGKRIPQQRVVSTCRDFSLILCALFRSKGIASRLRCGFATYLTPDHFEDHWICEYWNAQEMRWVIVDAQLDSVHLQNLNIDFSPFDVPSSRFIVAGEAWHLCRSGKLAPEKFGIHGLNGFAFIKGNVIRDLFALNKIELLCWDTGWGILKDYINPIQSMHEWALLDQLATVSQLPKLSSVKQIVELQDGVKFPVNWCFSMCPSMDTLLAKHQ